MIKRSELRFAELADGGHLSYAVAGQASSELPILLNRPLGGTMALWGPLLDTLAADFQVIAFDPRGVGRSSDLPWLHSTRAMARDALQLLNHLKLDRAHVFGLSLGGMVASWLAIDAAPRVGRLVLASTLPEPAALSHRFPRHAWAFARCLTACGAKAEVALVHEILSPQFQRAHPKQVLELEQQIRALPTKRRNLLIMLLAAASQSAESPLRHCPIQTLLLFGELDPLVGGKACRELLRALPNARFEMLTATGHDLSLERPQEVAQRIIRFLRE